MVMRSAAMQFSKTPSMTMTARQVQNPHTLQLRGLENRDVGTAVTA